MDQIVNDLTFPNSGNYGHTVDLERLRAYSHAGFCRSTVVRQKVLEMHEGCEPRTLSIKP